MEPDKKIALLKASIQVIAFLFASFGGFLLNIAPPNSSDTTLHFTVGITQFIALSILLFISAFTNYSLVLNAKKFKRNYRVWLYTSGICLIILIITAISYFNQYEKLVISIKKWDATYVRGALTDESLRVCKENKYSLAQCESYLLQHEYGAQDLDDGLLWTKESVSSNEMRLLYLYLGFIISLSLCLFSLTELLSAKFIGRGSKPAPAKALANTE